MHNNINWNCIFYMLGNLSNGQIFFPLPALTWSHPKSCFSLVSPMSYCYHSKTFICLIEVSTIFLIFTMLIAGFDVLLLWPLIHCLVLHSGFNLIVTASTVIHTELWQAGITNIIMTALHAWFILLNSRNDYETLDGWKYSAINNSWIFLRYLEVLK